MRLISGLSLKNKVYVCLVLWSPTLAMGGRLEDIRKDSESKSIKSSEETSTHMDLFDEKPPKTEAENALALMILFVMGGFVFAMPHYGVHDDFSNMHFYPEFPYQESDEQTKTNYLLLDKSKDSEEKKVGGRVGVIQEKDFHGMSLTRVPMILNTSYRVGLQGSLNYLSEQLDGNKLDRLSLHDINLVLQFAENRFMQMRSGLGRRFLSGGAHEEGLNFIYSIDVFPVRPLLVSSTFEVGTIGKTVVRRFSANAGFIYNRIELNAGYDILTIGGTVLKMPNIGLSLWY